MPFLSNLWVGHVFLSLYVVLLERVIVLIAVIQYLSKAIQEGKLLWLTVWGYTVQHGGKVKVDGAGGSRSQRIRERWLPIRLFSPFYSSLGLEPSTHKICCPASVNPFCKNAHRRVSMMTLNSIKLTMKISHHSCDIRVSEKFELGVGVATGFFLCSLRCITTDFLRAWWLGSEKYPKGRPHSVQGFVKPLLVACLLGAK